jgi:integrase
MSVKQFQRDGTWYYRFNQDKQTYQKYGFASYKEAKDAENLRIKEIIEGKTQFPTALKKLTVRDACQIFYDEYASKLDNWATYRPRLTLIATCFKNTLLKDIRKTDAAKLMNFAKETIRVKNRIGDKIIETPITEQTARHYYTNFKTVINWWITEKEIPFVNPINSITFDPIPKARVRFLYPAEEKILTPIVQTDIEVWPYYVAALETGLRISNLCSMKVKDVDLILGKIFIPISKNGRSGYIPISSKLRAVLIEAMREKQPMDKALGHFTHRSRLYVRFQELVKQAGVKDLTFHDLRHSFAYSHLSRGKSIYIVSQLLLHRDVKVTQEHYGHLAISDLDRVVNGGVDWGGYLSSLTTMLTTNEAAGRTYEGKVDENQQIGSVG